MSEDGEHGTLVMRKHRDICEASKCRGTGTGHVARVSQAEDLHKGSASRLDTCILGSEERSHLVHLLA